MTLTVSRGLLARGGPWWPIGHPREGGVCHLLPHQVIQVTGHQRATQWSMLLWRHNNHYDISDDIYKWSSKLDECPMSSILDCGLSSVLWLTLILYTHISIFWAIYTLKNGTFKHLFWCFSLVWFGWLIGHVSTSDTWNLWWAFHLMQLRAATV